MISGLDTLIAYTDWQRQYWIGYMRRHGSGPLDVSAGPGGDGRLATVRDIIRHIFSAEHRYIDRLNERQLIDPGAIPSDSADDLFAFGSQSRENFRVYLESCPDAVADVPQELRRGDEVMMASPRKIATHVLLHEIRHWAQIATILRFSGYKVDLQDFIFSPVID
jgi:uncharacterized damage-inducible protein DinB